MPISDLRPGDVVRVPFPYTDRPVRQHRPALVVTGGPIGDAGELLWVVMITSAENRPWTGDIAIVDLEAAGLPAASVVRPVKIATIERTHAEKLGMVGIEVTTAVIENIRRLLG